MLQDLLFPFTGFGLEILSVGLEVLRRFAPNISLRYFL